MKKIIISIIILVIIGVALYAFKVRKSSEDQIKIEYTTLQKSDIKVSVSCTGTLEATGEVEVGTELSGTFDEVLVDYNDEVVKDQIMAIMDTTKLVLQIKELKETLIQRELQMNLNKKKWENAKELSDKNYISDLDLLEAETTYLNSKSQYNSTLLSLDSKELDLSEYSIIKAPANGVVLDKNIEAGQTVSANLSAPVLFTLIEDFSEMEIYALVDETDIGDIQIGQNVTFTVEAYSDKEFSGIVKQVRLQPQIDSNVVKYTVVITVENKDKILLPGMTATIDIWVEEALDTYVVDSNVLNLKPSFELMESLMKKNRSDRDISRKRPTPPDGKMQEMESNISMIWVENEDGEIRPTRVTTGITDGYKTELIEIGSLDENSKIISSFGPTSSSSSSQNKSSNNQRRMGPPPGMF